MKKKERKALVKSHHLVLNCIIVIVLGLTPIPTIITARLVVTSFTHVIIFIAMVAFTRNFFQSSLISHFYQNSTFGVFFGWAITVTLQPNKNLI
jgi:hypothetical protein